MELLSIIFTCWFFLIIGLNFVSSKWSVALFIAYSILVPIIKINLGAISIGSRFAYLILVVFFFAKNYNRLHTVNFKHFYPFIFLFIAQGLLIPFQSGVPEEYALESYLTSVLSYILYPMTIYTLVILEKDSWILFRRVLLICGALFVIYGLFLTRMPGVNPYLMSALPIWGIDFNEAYALGYSALQEGTNLDIADGRVFGRISSFFSHPMTYGLNLGFLIFMCVGAFLNCKKLLIPMILLIIGAIFTCGIRTPILAIIISVGIVLLYKKNIKYLFWGTIALIVGVNFIISFLPDMKDFFFSMVYPPNGEEIKGSSFDMRLEQFWGCFDIIEDCPLVGKGFGWTSFYIEQHTTHPVLLSFESLIFVVLCNEGIIGAIIWAIFFFWTIRDICGFKDKFYLSLLLGIFLYYIFYSTITGDYGYMRYFMLYYVVCMGYVFHSQSKVSVVDGNKKRVFKVKTVKTL